MDQKSIKQNFAVTGMSCASCAARVEKVLNACDGVNGASVNFASGTVNIDYNGAECTPQSLQKAVRDAGYDLVLDNDADALQQRKDRAYRSLRRRTVWALVLSVPVVIIGMGFMNMPWANMVMFLLSTPVVFVLGRQFFAGAFKQLRHRTANMDTLVALSTGIAWLFSVANMLFPHYWMQRGIHPHVYFEAAAVIVAFILLGRTFEARAKGNTATAIKKLMGLSPKTVTIVLPDGTTRSVPVADVHAGDTVAVRPGERVAVDGTVESGTSYIDESMLSGEPVPVHKQPGSKVYAGTINGNGSLRCKAQNVGSDTLLSKIIAMVQDAQGSKAPVQQLVDRIAAVFVPVIIGIAAVAFAVWLIAGGQGSGFTHGLLAAVTVLIIACPCALGLATPTAIMVGIGKGADNGILIKDAEALETAPRINAVVLDKTGTVTMGQPTVESVEYLRTVPDAAAILSALESNSEHPLARAITENLGQQKSVAITDFKSETGMGVSGTVDGRQYFAGNRRYMEHAGIPVSDAASQTAAQMESMANTVVWFADTDGVISLTGITDPVKPTSAQAVARLKSMGIEVYMLTGDNRASAQVAARRAGIDHVEAEVLPGQKADFIASLQSSGKRVAMVGDGINDSAALARADLGIAMGTGSDIAIDVAKMTIVGADLAKIPVAIKLSRLTVRTIHQNLFWAFIYNAVGVPVAAGVLYPLTGFLLNPMIAGAAMAFSSVSVVANSLLLKRKKLTYTQPKTKHMTHTFKVEGMSCGHCRGHVAAAVEALPGTTSVQVDLASGKLTVDGTSTPEAIIKAVTDAGYTCKQI